MESLINNAPDKNKDYKSLNNDKLESKLVELHKNQLVIDTLKEKYISSMSQDMDMQKHLREQAHKRFETSNA